MITSIQLEQLSRKLKTNTTVAAREYLQLLFLQSFYELVGSKQVFFKGGTAIRFLMGGFRFSEDLDFTSEVSKPALGDLVSQAMARTREVVADLEVKEKKTLAGKTFLLTLPKGMVDFPIFVRLDFFFREKILQKEKDIIKNDFPVIFSAFVYHLGGEEILAEKVRAILTRKKGRDLFDFWFLLTKGYKLNENFIQAKMKCLSTSPAQRDGAGFRLRYPREATESDSVEAHYPKAAFSWKKVLAKVESYDFLEFKKDLLPFISLDKRAKIDEMFEIIKAGIKERIEGKQ